MQTQTLVKLIGSLFLIISVSAASANTAISSAAAGGYDLVSFHLQGGPERGSGHYLSEHKGTTYLFANKRNKKAFDANPEKFLPAYGGYCAYGVSVGKKFYGDPTVWKVVDGTLYFNLDNKVQKIWAKDIPGHIVSANEQWNDIRNTPASEL